MRLWLGRGFKPMAKDEILSTDQHLTVDGTVIHGRQQFGRMEWEDAPRRIIERVSVPT